MTVLGVASNTADAFRQARALRPDVVLVDIGLGDESGFDLARALAEVGQLGGAGVIMVSARAEMDYAELIAASSAAEFLAKSSRRSWLPRPARAIDPGAPSRPTADNPCR